MRWASAKRFSPAPGFSSPPPRNSRTERYKRHASLMVGTARLRRSDRLAAADRAPALLLDPDIAGLGDLAPARDVGGKDFCKLFRGIADGVDAERLEACNHVRQLCNPHQFAFELFHDSRRRFLWRENSTPQHRVD